MELAAKAQIPFVFGASVIGPLHIQMGLPCQDACAFRLLDEGASVLAVADGLGSASRSEVGATIAVQTTIEVASQLLSEAKAAPVLLDSIASACVEGARGSLERRATEDKCSLRDLACTLIVVVERGGRASVAHIGDGAVVVEVPGGLQLLSAPGESEYTNEVVPLTSQEWKEALRIVPSVDGVRCLAAFTDGCQRAALRKSTDGLEPFPGFFGPIFSFARELDDPSNGEEEIRSLLSSKKMCNNSEDDKTLVVAVFGSG